MASYNGVPVGGSAPFARATSVTVYPSGQYFVTSLCELLPKAAYDHVDCVLLKQQMYEMVEFKGHRLFVWRCCNSTEDFYTVYEGKVEKDTVVVVSDIMCLAPQMALTLVSKQTISASPVYLGDMPTAYLSLYTTQTDAAPKVSPTGVVRHGSGTFVPENANVSDDDEVSESKSSSEGEFYSHSVSWDSWSESTDEFEN